VPGPKTNEREGTRAILRHARISPSKVREVLDLIRGKPVGEAAEILRFSERDAAIMVGKVLASAVANAEANDAQDPEELFVSACFADEGTTIKRWRPRARGRATRIRKRTSHVTVIVSRLPEDRLARLHARRQAEQSARRARRVAGARRSAAGTAPAPRGRLGRRRAAKEDAPTAADVAAAEDEAGIVDETAPALAAAEAAELESAEVESAEVETAEGEAAEAEPVEAEAVEAEAVAAESAEEPERAEPAEEPETAEAAEAETAEAEAADTAEASETPQADKDNKKGDK
jgi:large subunit ribosomal protein L22